MKVYFASERTPYVVKTFQGLEQMLALELERLGAEDINILKRAVSFKGDKRMMYMANMHLRTAIRILKPLAEFTAKDEDDLYQGMSQIPWEKYMQVDQTLAVDAVVGSHLFKHSQYVALKTKDAVVDRFRRSHQKRPSVNLENPHLRIHVNLQGREVKVLLDSSNESLHKRGYRKLNHPAPISEVLAAGMIMLAGWNGEQTFFDPMCGSGTIAIEAALIASQTAPGMMRSQFGFHSWPDYDRSLWKKVKAEARHQQKDIDVEIFASDRSTDSLDIARRHVEEADMEGRIQFRQRDFLKSGPPAESGLMMMNPPYGERLMKEGVSDFYKVVGDQMKQQYKGWKAWIISADLESIKKIGLRASKKYSLFNGPLPCKYQGYELY